MAKGYVYIMTSAIDGLIKIGKSKDWNRRCKDELESNGYKNINALKTYYVVECDDYDEVESIMHDIFRESRVSNIEAFAVDKDRAKRVLSRMGEQVYPEVVNVNSNVFTKKTSSLPQYYANFWTMLTKELDSRPNIDNLTRKGTKDCRIYYTERRFPLHTKWGVNVDIYRKSNKICVSVFTRATNAFSYLQVYMKNKDIIEKELGYQLVWNDTIDGQDINKIKRISYYIDYNIDLDKPIDPKVVKEAADKLIEMCTVFNKY